MSLKIRQRARWRLAAVDDRVGPVSSSIAMPCSLPDFAYFMRRDVAYFFDAGSRALSYVGAAAALPASSGTNLRRSPRGDCRPA